MPGTPPGADEDRRARLRDWAGVFSVLGNGDAAVSDDRDYSIYLLVLAALVFFAWAFAPVIDAWGEQPKRECPKEQPVKAKRAQV